MTTRETYRGVLAIGRERSRQVRLGFDAAHDAGHLPGLFAMEASIYAREAAKALLHPDAGPDAPMSDVAPADWPQRLGQGGCDWKPRNPLRALEKAGALVAAEIDRSGPATPVADDSGEPSAVDVAIVCVQDMVRLTTWLADHADRLPARGNPVTHQPGETAVDLAINLLSSAYPSALREFHESEASSVVAPDDHVLVVVYPASSFTTSEQAAAATSTALTDMTKCLGVLSPQVTAASRQGETR